MRPLAPTDTKPLRQFGLGLAGLIVALFGLAIPWLADEPLPVWPWWLGGALAALALAWPRGIHPIYTAWLPLARVLGWVNNWMLLGFVFFVVLLPFGVYARFARKLHYQVGFDREAATYKVRRESDGPVTDLKKPY
jgi:hypothetical protein